MWQYLIQIPSKYSLENDEGKSYKEWLRELGLFRQEETQG